MKCFVCEIKKFMRNSLTNLEPTKIFHYESGMIELVVLVKARAAELRTS